MKRKILRMIFIIAIISSLFTGCGKNNGTSEANSGGGDERFTIVTSFYPMYISTLNIVKDIAGVEVVNMTKPQTGCLHDYQLTPEDLKILERADVFVINGAGMEAFMDKVLQQQEALKIIEASKGIELLKDENGEVNPHVWVSISDAITQVRNISDRLAAIDTPNASAYKDYAGKYIARLEALKVKMHKELEGIKGREIVTFHEAFPYFAKEFDLKIASVIEREPGSEPSPRELEDTINTIRESKIKALFAEPQYDAKAADTIARETGAKVCTLDPVVTGEARLDAYDDYINAMEKNLKTLQEALKNG